MPFVLDESKLIYSTSDLKEAGLSYFKIARQVEEGKLSKLSKSLYENLCYKGDFPDYIIASAIAGGTICLMSAAIYHNLTTCRTDAIEVAIGRKDRVSTIPDWPPISLHYYSDSRFGLGAIEVKEGNDSFKVFDPEKTVVDIISFKDKVGVEETKEVLTKYLQRRDRNLNKLLSYAKELRCDARLKAYLEVLL